MSERPKGRGLRSLDRRMGGDRMRYLRRTLVLGCCLALSACAKATEIYGPDGESAMLIECPGAAVPLSTCFEKAAEVCPSGYALLDTYEGGSAASITPYGGYAATGVNKRVLVRCNESTLPVAGPAEPMPTLAPPVPAPTRKEGYGLRRVGEPEVIPLPRR